MFHILINTWFQCACVRSLECIYDHCQRCTLSAKLSLSLSLMLSLSLGGGGGGGEGGNCSHRSGKTCSVQAVFKFVDFWLIKLINEADHRPNKMPNSSEAHRLGIGIFHPVLMEILKKKVERSTRAKNLTLIHHIRTGTF